MSALCFPLKVLDAHAAVLGKTGAGKSSAMRHVVEYLHSQNKRVVIIDPKGDWWGLKSDATGKGKGFPVIAFGSFKSDEDVADVPINEESGKDVAELIVGGNRPAIIGFRGWYTAHMLKFWIDFAKGLFHGNQGELYLFIDEIQNFAPKGSTRTIEGQGGLALHWANRMLAEGRGLGINIWIGSQRPQKVHNDTLDGCETLVAMRSVHPAARGAINDWMKGAADKEKSALVLDALGAMKRGEAFIWSPEIEFGPQKVEFPMFTTFDSFAPPQLQKKVQRKGWASVDLDVVKEKLARIVEEKEHNDPTKLHQRIRTLERDLATAQRSQPATPSKVETVEVPILTPTEIKQMKNSDAAIAKQLSRVAGALEAVTNVLPKILEQMQARDKRMTAIEEILRVKPLSRVAPVPAPTPRPKQEAVGARGGTNSATVAGPRAATNVGPRGDTGDNSVTPVMQRILNALAELEQLGASAPKRQMVAILSGYTHIASTGFTKALSSLSSAGCVSYPGSGTVALTDTGRQIAVAPARPSTPEEVQQRVFKLLGGKTAEILRPIVAAYPNDIPRTDVMTASGYSNLASTGFTKALSRLSSLGFVTYPGKGTVKASPILFLEQ